MSEQALRFGIIGCGRVIQELHLPAWALVPEVQLTALCDANPAILQTLTERYPGVRSYRDVGAFLDDSADLDFVVLATPGITHPTLGEQVLQHDLHLLCEKPLALDSTSAQRLYTVAAQAGKLLVPIHNYRYRDNVQEALQWTATGALGDITNVQVRFRSGLLFDEPSRWMHNERQHRILLFDFAYHFIDIALLFLEPLAELRFVDAEVDTVGLQYVVFGTRHQNGARGLFELMFDASAQGTWIDVLGETASLQLEFFPDGFRKMSGRDQPLKQGIAQAQRLSHFVRHTARHKLLKAPSHRILPHARLFQAFVTALRCAEHKREDSVAVVPKAEVLAMISLLSEVANHAYGFDTVTAG